MQKKKIIILSHNGGRLANQLWLFISMYAFCLENDYNLENYSFWEYAKFFNFKITNLFINTVFFKLYFLLCIIIPRNPIYKFREFYGYYIKLIKKIYPNKIIYAINSSGVDTVVNLSCVNKMSDATVFDSGNVYTIGWMFRNSNGIIKYQKEIIKYFKPKEEIVLKINKFISVIRGQYRNVIGVHIRQGDYKTWFGGKYYFSQDKIKNIIEEFLIQFKLDNSDCAFIISSDGIVEDDIFSGLNIFHSLGGVVEDLFTLARTDIIIGSDSTFGAFASYYGNIPFVVFDNSIDWGYYINRKVFFENQYSTLVHY